MIIERKEYLDKLISWKDKRIIKIVTGVRRCGKSMLLKIYQNYLKNQGIDENQIIAINFEDLDYEELTDYKKLYAYLKERLIEGKMTYIFLDEIQNVENFPKVLDSLYIKEYVDIYVTGSNSKLMSSEISTYLTGRYVLIPVYPLSFKEYLDFKSSSTKSKKELLNEYIKFGGFPIVALGNYDEQSAYQIVEGIYNSVITNDITKRHNIVNFDLFNRVVKFIIENVGKTFSANSIVKFLKGEGRALSVESIYNYLEWLEKAFVIYRCRRYNLQGKSVLKTQEKFYLADPSLKYCIMGFNPKSIASMLENIVYFELKRRSYEVYIGKLGTKEIDFVAIKRDERIYVQVCRTLPENSDREIGNLLAIKDQYPKYVVTLDELSTGNVNGVKIIHLFDFLLKEDF